MKPRVFAVVPLMCLTAVAAIPGSARAQATAPPPPAPDLPPRGETFESQFRRLFDGQPVIAVWPSSGTGYEGTPVRPGTRLLTTLQAFGEAFSTREDHLIPFAVRGVWILAPETRTDLNTDFRGYSLMDALSHDEALKRFLLSLTEKDIQALGAPDGTPSSFLSPSPNALLASVLSRRLRVKSPGIYGALPLPTGFDLRTARVRLVLRATVPEIRIEPNNARRIRTTSRLNIDQRSQPTFVHETDEYSRQFNPTNIPLTLTVKNSFKPSDLDGSSILQTFGVEGRVPVNDALKRLQEKTGLELIASRQFQEYSLFLGREDLTCGDVMDALRLCLSAAWRKVGPAYILAWDRRPTSQVLEESYDAAAHLTAEVRQSQMDTFSHPNWLMLAEEVPFAPDDPFRWSAGQRALLFGPVLQPQNSLIAKHEIISYPRFTPEQKAAAREALSSTKVSFHDQTVGAVVDRPADEVDLQSTLLKPSAKLELSVLVPDIGWILLQGDFDMTLSQGNLDNIRSEHRIREQGRRQAAAGKPARTWTLEAQPFTPDADVRGVMLGPLPPSRLKALAPALKKSGINAVFYPALTNGFATFPSQAFPLHPSLGGADGLAAAVREMKAAGIPVIACVEALTWQRNQDPRHWMAKHPDWLDVDRKGRTPFQLIDAIIPAQQRPNARALVRGNVVRITEPEVTRRLAVLMDEVARAPGLAGVCLADWRPFTGSIQVKSTERPETGGTWGRSGGLDGRPPIYTVNQRLPELGFALPDRLASLRKTGIDPVDVVPSSARMPFIRLASPSKPEVLNRPLSSVSSGVDAPDDRYLHFANGLIERVRKVNPAMPTLTVAEYSARRNEVLPAARTVLRVVLPGNSSDAPALLLPVPNREEASPVPGIEREDPYAVLPPVARVLMRQHVVGKRAAIVFDFRAQPDELDESLKYIVPPGTVPPGQPPFVTHRVDGPAAAAR